MRTVGTSVIASPTGALPDFHLMAAVQNPSGKSLLYVPLSDKPGLSLDVIRIDRLPQAPISLEAILQQWLVSYRQFSGGSEFKFSVAGNSANEFLIYAGFSNHRIIGDHHTVWRYLRDAGHDYSIQFIRKLEPVPAHEIGERISFLGACQLSPEMSGSGLPAYTEFATKAHAHSEQIRLLTVAGAKSEVAEMPTEKIGAMLVNASPFHYPECWANYTRFYGRSVVLEGRIDDFGTAAQCLKLALVTLNDARDDGFLERLLYDVAENLADLLMYTYGDARASNVARAIELYRAVADVWSESQPERALTAEVMAGFGCILNDPDSRKPLDAWFSERARAALKEKKRIPEVIDFLVTYEKRMAYIARRKGRHLYNDACLAADLAQLVSERAYGDSSSSFEDSGVGDVTQAFQAQLDSQLGLFGLTQKDLDRSAAAFGARYRRSPDLVPGLLLLRPLATSRRIKTKNRFGSYYADQLSSIVPDTLTLESALHLAFRECFDNQALGGPIDLFGMARSTALGESSGAPSWQDVASLLIRHARVVIVLFEETNALLWEMSEISRQRAFGKLVLVVPPFEGEQPVEGYSDTAAHKLRELGFDLPKGVRNSGFFLLNDSGSVAQVLPFESLWSGELLHAVLERS